MVYTVEDENGVRIALVELDPQAEKWYYLSLPLFPGKIFIPTTYLNLAAIKPFFAERSIVTRIEQPL